MPAAQLGRPTVCVNAGDHAINSQFFYGTNKDDNISISYERMDKQHYRNQAGRDELGICAIKGDGPVGVLGEMYKARFRIARNCVSFLFSRNAYVVMSCRRTDSTPNISLSPYRYGLYYNTILSIL